MRTAEEYRALAEMHANECAFGESPDEPCGKCFSCKTAAALREAANLREWMQLIYDFDDGAWAAGKHAKEARRQGITTMRGMAAAALRGESILGGESHD